MPRTEDDEALRRRYSPKFIEASFLRVSTDEGIIGYGLG